MRLAISNIAWDPAEDLAVARLLEEFKVDAIDVAPGKYFPNPINVSNIEVANVKRWWLDHGIEIIGMQALLFGTVGLNVFGSTESRKNLLNHLSAICRIGSNLGATRLVFGSPKNRDRSSMDDAQTLDLAISFFQDLGEIAHDNGVIVCLEPNPTRYGANFMTNSTETSEIVRAVSHCAIQMQFDTGAITLNKESPQVVLENNFRLIGHVHVSEPDLVPLGDGETDHRLMYQMMMKYIPEKIVTIEMLATTSELHLQSIRRSLLCALNAYRIG